MRRKFFLYKGKNWTRILTTTVGKRATETKSQFEQFQRNFDDYSSLESPGFKRKRKIYAEIDKFPNE